MTGRNRDLTGQWCHSPNKHIFLTKEDLKVATLSCFWECLGSNLWDTLNRLNLISDSLGLKDILCFSKIESACSLWSLSQDLMTRVELLPVVDFMYRCLICISQARIKKIMTKMQIILCGYNKISCYCPLVLHLATTLYSDLHKQHSQELFVK